LPGLTGLAQVNLAPDRTIDDVRKKIVYDHAYAIQLTKPCLWIKVELIILVKTIQNVLLGKGQ
jgi:lipopolysaccharide/colanic/teichoic acid biosynthesis glycosyltransferase